MYIRKFHGRKFSSPFERRRSMLIHKGVFSPVPIRIPGNNKPCYECEFFDYLVMGSCPNCSIDKDQWSPRGEKNES